VVATHGSAERPAKRASRVVLRGFPDVRDSSQGGLGVVWFVRSRRAVGRALTACTRGSSSSMLGIFSGMKEAVRCVGEEKTSKGTARRKRK